MSSFTTCAACGYIRQPTDAAPDWECPKCQKAYVKTSTLVQKEKREPPRPVAPRLLHEQASIADPERTKRRHLLTVLTTAALLGSALFLLYQFKWKRDGFPFSATAKAVATFKTMMRDADGYYAFVRMPKEQWRVTSEKWVQEAVVAAYHTDGTISLGIAAVAQSFVPQCDIIRAIQMNLYTTGAAPGWIRFQITDNAGGTPGQVLETAWLLIDNRSPVPTGGYITVPFHDVPVKPNETYWFTIVEFRNPSSSPRNLTGLGVSNRDTYTQGTILLPSKYAVKGVFDANFRIITEFRGLPGVRAVMEVEKRGAPSPEEQEAAAHIWTQDVPPPVEMQK